MGSLTASLEGGMRGGGSSGFWGGILGAEKEMLRVGRRKRRMEIMRKCISSMREKRGRDVCCDGMREWVVKCLMDC